MIVNLIAIREGVKWIHVPQRGVAEDIAAVLGGHVHASANASRLGASG
jgi:hypothetical protein